MSYKIKNGKMVRRGKASGTIVRTFERPADWPVYRESEAEKAARLGDVVQFEKRTSPDGRVVVYCVPGLEPDCRETLEAAGPIKQYQQDDGGYRTEVYEPHNPRVLAWQISVNRQCAAQGLLPMFPGVPVPIEATDTVQ